MVEGDTVQVRAGHVHVHACFFFSNETILYRDDESLSTHAI